MDYFEVTLKIPKPTWHWLRFRIHTILLVMTFVAVTAVALRIHNESKPTRLVRAYRDAQAARDKALVDWHEITSSRSIKPNEEAAARSNYFLWRAEAEEAQQRLANNGIDP